MSPFRATDARLWTTGSPKTHWRQLGGNVRRTSRRKASRARGVSPRRGVSSAPSWPGTQCVLGAAELAAHPRSRPSSMPANHVGCSRRTPRGGAARAMARHAGYRRGSAPYHGLVLAGLRRHPSALRWPPTRGVAPPAARGRVFVRRRTLCAVSLCVTVDRALVLDRADIRGGQFAGRGDMSRMQASAAHATGQLSRIRAN